VGAIVIVIVVTAGMVSTTWVQFLKGSLLVVFSTLLAAMILVRGFEVREGGLDGYEFRTLGPFPRESLQPELAQSPALADAEIVEPEGEWQGAPFVRTRDEESGVVTVWTDKLNFLSLMLALFCGTASLPHILIRYYTVKDEAAPARARLWGSPASGSSTSSRSTGAGGDDQRRSWT
jgi:Na+(H+)/acetate symporter ActP